jgi:hypothetical protein
MELVGFGLMLGSDVLEVLLEHQMLLGDIRSFE